MELVGGDEEDQVDIHCLQGSRQGRVAQYILWIGKKDEEGSLIWQGKRILDLYFRFLNDGLLTLHVWCTVDVKIKVVVDWVVDFLATKR